MSRTKSLALALVLSGTLGLGDAFAQTYTIASTPQTYVPLIGATTVTPSNKDEGYATIPLGFSFPYYGQSFTSVLAHANGMLLFPPNTVCTNGAASVCYGNGALPNASRTYHNVIAGWWDDLQANATTAALRYVKPSASEIVIEYYDWGYFSGGGQTFAFQIHLNASGMFQVHYGAHSGASPYGSASAGFENATGTQGASLLTCTPSCTGGAGGYWPTNTLYTIGQPAEADLTVPVVATSNMAVDAGVLSVTISPTIQNIGRTDAGDFLWSAYLSTDRSLQRDGGSSDGGYPDTLIYTSTTPLQCHGVAGVADTASVTMSPAPPPGQYYVLVEADPTNLITEASKNNNVGSTATYFTQGADLVATAIAGPSDAGPGGPMSLHAEWFNQGTDSVGPTGYKIYLSTTTTPHPSSDYVLYTGSRDITGGQTVNDTIPITAPQNIPGGEFYYVLGLDPGNLVAEASKTNNFVVSAGKVFVKQSDLVIDPVDFLDPVTDIPTATGFFSQQGRMRVAMHNAGSAAAPAFSVGVVISTDTTLSLLSDTIAHDEPVAGLAPGASQTVTFNFTIPLKDRLLRNFATGSYYLFGMLDSFSVVTELSKNNNILMVTGAVSLRAPSQDYAVTRVDASASAAVGEVAPLFRVIKNVGNVAGSQVTYKYFASVNGIVTTEDIPLGIVGTGGAVSDSGSLTLGIGAEDSRTEFVKLPPSMPPGAYFFGCVVDPGNLVPELDEANNALASGLTVQVAASSLRVATPLLPDGTADRPYYFRLVALGAPSAPTWSIDTANGSLPDGLSLDAQGSITGTPTTPSVSAFTVLLQSGLRQASARLVLRVLPSTSELEVTTRALPPVINSASIPYQGSLGAAGGVKPYAWRVAGGSLPNGILLSSEGLFSGAAKAGVPVGETLVSFEVQDSVGTRARASLKVRVVVPGALLVKNLILPDSLVNYDYLTDLAAENADGSALALPLTWSIAAGALPDGLVVSPLDGERGIISGKPLVAGNYAFSVQVVDAKGRADVADFILRVFPVRFRVTAVDPPTILHPGDTVDFTLSTAGAASATTRFKLYSGTLPPGVALSPLGQVSGTVATEHSVGTFNFAAEAKDAFGGSGLGAFSLEVTGAPKAAGCAAAPGNGWLALGLLAVLLRRARSAPRRTTCRSHAGLPPRRGASL